MENNNKKKIVIGSIIGVILLLLIIVSVAYSKGNNKEEVAENETEKVNIDSTVEDLGDVAQGNLISDTEETVEKEVPATEKEESSETTEPEEPQEEKDTEEPLPEETTPEEIASEANEPYVSETPKTNSWGTSQEYNGDPEGRGPGRIIVNGFNYNDFGNGLSWEGEYWTASNGVEIKVVLVDGRDTGMVPVPDGKGKDNEPTSPFQIAMAEAEGANINKYNADLNVTIPLATYKRTDIDINDANLVAYRNAYDYKLYANMGMAEYYEPYKQGDPINLRFAVASDGIGEFDSVGAQFWRIRRVNDYWEVKINAFPAEFRWDGIHQVLRYLSPDGDSLYNIFYEDFYYGSPVILEYDEWFAVGNSQILQKDTEDMDCVIYYFK